MHINKCNSFIFLPFIFWPSPTFCQRRIVDGRTTNVNATFVVYLLRGEPATVGYKGWLCGGCIVDRWFVLTSAACLEDVQFVYVVAGYDKYVSGERMESDQCITKTRKKIVNWCRQKKYFLGNYPEYEDWDYSRLWASTDIALAQVHEPFDFQDPVYLQYCSYLPSMISVGYAYLHGIYGGSALAYGWGHRKYMRENGDLTDYNSESLYYAQVKIISKDVCKEQFPLEFIKENIQKHGICTSGPGFLDDEGHLTNLMDLPTNDCDNASNDHGGPLVTWVGTKKYVIGVASFFRVTRERMCTQPFVFMSTSCVNQFLICILSETRRFESCAEEHNMQIVENHSNWNASKTSATETKYDPSTQE